METEKLVFKFEEDNNEFSYENKVILIQDKKLINDFGRENIRNGNSSLLIKSLDNLPVYDVIQLKINVADTGTFLANFKKENVDEKTREEMLTKIKELKDDVSPTYETQQEKIKKLIKILNLFNPLYVSYKNNGDIKIDFDSLKDETTNFPLLVLQKLEKPKKIKVAKEPKARKEFKIHFKKIHFNFRLPQLPKIKREFPLFDWDYAFVTVFAMLFAFAIFTGVYEIMSGQSVAVFLLVLSGIFIGVEYYVVYSTIYHKGKLRFQGLRYWLILYILVGCAIGYGVGFVVSKFALINNIENFDWNLVFATTVPTGCVAITLSIYGSIIINLITKKVYKL